MTDRPVATLVVEGEPADWLFWHKKTRGGQSNIRIDDLPAVRDPDGCMVDGKMLYHRPLRVGDRVTLATWVAHPATNVNRMFATATVAEIARGGGMDPLWPHLITVEDVEAL